MDNYSCFNQPPDPVVRCDWCGREHQNDTDFCSAACEEAHGWQEDALCNNANEHYYKDMEYQL
jgi:hypothetical protein